MRIWLIYNTIEQYAFRTKKSALKFFHDRGLVKHKGYWMDKEDAVNDSVNEYDFILYHMEVRE